MPTLSIITVTFQSAGKLPNFLASTKSAAPDAECIVVDNASADGTARVASQCGADRVIVSESNLGFGRACNVGAVNSTGEWLLFANPDLTLERIPSIRASNSSPFGIVGSSLSEKGTLHRPSLRAEAHFAEDAISQLLFRVAPQGIAWLAPQRRHPSRWASGALLLCRRDEFLNVGGFDPRFFLYFEDRDLARKYRRVGYPLRLDPHLRGTHGHGESSSNVPSWRLQACSLASWIEYRGIWHGASAARRTAELSLSVLSTICRLGKHTSDTRAQRKSAEAAEILAFLLDLERQMPEPAGYHPVARAVLSEARRP
jgi:GT2 family glycosyltransferase